MSARSAAASGGAALLTATLSVLATATPARSSGTATRGGQPLPGSAGEVGHIASPSDRDRYVLEGADNPGVDNPDKLTPGLEDARPGDTRVRISGSLLPPTCTAAQALRVGLYNPEGRFVRRIQPDAEGDYALIAPRIPGRYVLKLGIEDPACAGLRYRISSGPLTGAG